MNAKQILGTLYLLSTFISTAYAQESLTPLPLASQSVGRQDVSGGLYGDPSALPPSSQNVVSGGLYGDPTPIGAIVSNTPSSPLKEKSSPVQGGNVPFQSEIPRGNQFTIPSQNQFNRPVENQFTQHPENQFRPKTIIPVSSDPSTENKNPSYGIKPVKRYSDNRRTTGTPMKPLMTEPLIDPEKSIMPNSLISSKKPLIERPSIQKGMADKDLFGNKIPEVYIKKAETIDTENSQFSHENQFTQPKTIVEITPNQEQKTR